ncbi:DNA-3-methyladenine glycosylase I [Oceanospirillum multiglobuliferum]|uniref:3-methyladenine DNA glycosylase n=1 Tax=Oceanospirillum multiglobuliferum TaxID=64969 RepID=A0A1T4RYN2_9GAMM|nr:DNA-3-methyladenine glycosylase I [Oceanospirillum multiglobuliferum]OPX54598.1 3-methyladenine DNA glycosylase [Oceanospirillum multiglobuliferum]SKA20691.1 DNA-3-methyladenine glycosylase I [Oceanospirillum multiglobuliferum]
MNPAGLILGQDQQHRCWWCGENDALYQHYHDHEWGHPVTDDVRLFEKICLEGFQAGLSWITILRKRENFRAAFAGFDFHKLTHFTEQDVERLLQDAGIIRHRGKIQATLNNAARAVEMQQEFGSLAAYFWHFEPTLEQRPNQADYESIRQIAQTELSQKMSKDLKKRGWKFVGPTTCYAFMQAMGLVNDHLEGCYARQVCLDARAALDKPIVLDK